MINMVSSGGVGLRTPCDLIGLVVLSIVPGVVSLSIWINVRVAILDWISGSVLLN